MVEKIKSGMQFLTEVNREFSRVVWPSKNDLLGSTIVVLMVVVFFSIYLGCVDFIFSRLANIIF